MGGVFITELTGLIPPEGALITVQCQVEDQEIEIKASVDSSVAHSLSNIRSDETVKSIGVKFQDHSQKGHSRHDFVLLLIPDLPPRTRPPSKLDSEPFEVHCTG